MKNRLRIKDILSAIDTIKFIGDEQVEIIHIEPLNPLKTDKNNIYWCNFDRQEDLKYVKNGTFIVPSQFDEQLVNAQCNYIFVETPRAAFRDLISIFFNEIDPPACIEKSAYIHPSNNLPICISIGHNTVIEENCTFGNNVIIGHNTVIKKNTIVGNNVRIGSNTSIGDGRYSFERNKEGRNIYIPHNGNVILKDNVQIGNNTCVDRAVMGSTILEENVKIDSMVYIAHGVHIDENTLIVGKSIICGSVTIGKNVWVSPNSSIIDHISIGDNVLVGLGSVVIENVPNNLKVVGNPARVIKKKSST